MNAKEYLKQIEKLNRQIENKMIEREQWRSIAHNVSSNWGGERVQSSGNPDKMSNAIVNYLEIENEINACIAALIEKKKEIIGVIETLNADEYDLLHKVYVQGLTLGEAAYACDKSQTSISTLHGRALKKVQDLIDEREKRNEESQNEFVS